MCHSRFGDQVKIIHFIGASKPWLQYFNTETMEVSTAPGFEHLKGIFEHWWNVFCKHVHSTLSPVMVSMQTINELVLLFVKVFI